MTDLFRILARYNAWANRRLYGACAALPDAEYRAERGAFFGSIHGTLNHILVADRIWQSRFTDEAHGIPTLDTVLYDDFSQLREARTAEDARMVDLVDGMNDARFKQILAYRNMAGETVETPIGLVLAHLFNHATHHRGQVHGMLSQVPADPPPLDLAYFLREAA
jgi:uncharacterized damage-inducible protein DinB